MSNLCSEGLELILQYTLHVAHHVVWQVVVLHNTGGQLEAMVAMVAQGRFHSFEEMKCLLERTGSPQGQMDGGCRIYPWPRVHVSTLQIVDRTQIIYWGAIKKITKNSLHTHPLQWVLVSCALHQVTSIRWSR